MLKKVSSCEIFKVALDSAYPKRIGGQETH